MSGEESDTPMADELERQEVQADIEKHNVDFLIKQNKELKDTVTNLTAMCYTLARRLRNESFNDTILSVQRQQMAEMAMQSLNMTTEVWELVHKSEEQQQQNNI